MDLNGDWFIVASIEGDKECRLRVFCGIAIRRPGIIVGLKMKPKVGAEMPRNCGAKISSCCDACGTALEVGMEMVMARTCSHCREYLVAVKVPEETIAHVCEGGGTRGVGNKFGIGSVS
jgi:hypothetical protein